MLESAIQAGLGELLAIAEKMGARETDSERVMVLNGSVGRVASRLLALELSGIRDCGGVRERLDSLERESFAASMSWLSLVDSLGMWRLLWRCIFCGARNLVCSPSQVPCHCNPGLTCTQGTEPFSLGESIPFFD